MPRLHRSKPFRLVGGLFFLAALAFTAAGAVGDQTTFFGIAAAFLGVAFTFIARGRKPR